MVADFGFALALSAAAGGRLTETGLSLGTPHYMSPEQATAETELTNRSDIYSLGSVLYEMLTGSPPHVGASVQQIIMKIVTEDAAPLTKLRKAVPANVAAAVAKSLEKLRPTGSRLPRRSRRRSANPPRSDPRFQRVLAESRPPGGEMNDAASRRPAAALAKRPARRPRTLRPPSGHNRYGSRPALVAENPADN